jgi:glycosyltransferase involved in cell wall biosynthesis
MPPIRHIVYECLPGAYAGGVQKMVFELASAQRRLGQDVEVWTVDADRAGQTELHGALPIRYFSPDYALGYIRSRELNEALSTLPQDAVVHAHSTFHPLNHDIAVVARRLGLRHFFHPHGALDPVLFVGWSLKSLKKRLYHRFIGRPDLDAATGVFALTPLEAEQLAELGVSGRVHVVPNGIEPSPLASPEAAAAFRTTHRIGECARLLLFVGRIMPKKRLEDIISAFATLRVDMPDLVLAIAGNVAQDVAYHQRLLDLAADLGCSEAIRWLGFLDEKAKPVAFGAAEAFVTLPNPRAWRWPSSKRWPPGCLSSRLAGVICVVRLRPRLSSNAPRAPSPWPTRSGTCCQIQHARPACAPTPGPISFRNTIGIKSPGG